MEPSTKKKPRPEGGQSDALIRGLVAQLEKAKTNRYALDVEVGGKQYRITVERLKMLPVLHDSW
jgi:hypothetical protein